MSLSINLIFPDEQRSGGKINPKSLRKIITVAVPLLLLVIIMQQGLSHFVLQTNLSMQESRWQAAEPRQNHAKRLRNRLNQNQQIQNEIDAWKRSVPGWETAILAIMESTPENIHIATLRMQAIPAPNQAAQGSPPIRRTTVLIEGRVSEPDAMRAIESLRTGVETHALLQETVHTATVVNFAADPTAPGTPRRVFSIRILFNDLP